MPQVVGDKLAPGIKPPTAVFSGHDIATKLLIDEMKYCLPSSTRRDGGMQANGPGSTDALLRDRWEMQGISQVAMMILTPK